MLEIIDGILVQMSQMVFGLLYVHIDVRNLLLSFLYIELRDFANWLLAQLQHMVARYFLAEQFAVWVKSPLYACNLVFPCVVIFFLQHFVYPLFKEYLFQRHPVPSVFQLPKKYLQFLSQQVFRAQGRVAQYVTCRHENGSVVHNYASLRREVYLAVGKCIQGVYHLVGRYACGQITHYLHLGGGVVVDFLYLDFALLVCLQYTIYQHVSGYSIRYLGYNYRLPLLIIVHFRSYAQLSSDSGVIILRHIYLPSRRKIGIYLKRLFFQYLYRCLQQLTKIVRQYIRSQCNGYAFSALSQQQRELDG